MLIKNLKFLLCFAFLTSCIFVKNNDNKDEDRPAQQVQLTPKPVIIMSDELVRSSAGDMIAFLPQEWLFFDDEKKAPAEVFAIAVNRDYNLQAVFSEIRKTPQLEEKYNTGGLIGLADYCYDKKSKKTAGAVQIMSAITEIEQGTHRFAKYEISNSGGLTFVKSAVFKSNIDNFYEFSLIPMDIMGKPALGKEYYDAVFNSILATIKY